jgi:P-type Ca2+ transporter type 2C
MSTTASDAPVWALDIDTAVTRTDATVGLTSETAAARLRAYGPNRLEEPPPVPTWRKLAEQFANPLVYLLLVAVAVSLAAWLLEGRQGLPFDVIVITFIVIANAVLGYVQEARAEHAVAALRRLAAPTATVIRDGAEQVVHAEDLVPGDLLILSAGDSIDADARLIEAAALSVAEASLTGESQPVLKSTRPVAADAPLGDRVDMVFAGTAVTSGRGRAIVASTGMNTQIGAIAELLTTTADDPTPLQREIGYVGRALGIAVVVITVVVVAAILLTSDLTSASDLVDVLLVGVSLAVAAVPEGLPAVLSLVLALGVQRMASKRAIVKRLLSVEALGSASVVCTDKTGTLTRNEMAVQVVVTPSGSAEVTGTGYAPSGEVIPDHDDPAILDEVRAVLTGGSLANDARLLEVDGEWTIVGDPTEAAFLVAEAKMDGVTELRTERFERVGEIPFTSERKLMTTLQADRDHEGQIAAVTKGAPDVLLARCSSERIGDEVRPLTQERRDAVLREVDRLAGRALRTLGVAYRPLPDVTSDEDVVEHDLVYLGMVGLIDPPRDEARDAVVQAQRAGIRVIMITGDHPITASRIAEDLGIAGPDDAPVSGHDLDRFDQHALRKAVRTTSVFARVAPEHKLHIIDALQSDGHVVAMTGDGVNDAPALKSADIGVAMGVTGTDVAKEASDMILTDDNFATIISAVEEGRGIFANIRKFLRFLLSSNIGEVLTMFFGVVLAGVIGLGTSSDGVAIPLLAVQILWINLLTDTAPALALGVDPPPHDLMSTPPRPLGARVIDATMWRGIAWVGVVMAVVSLAALDLGMPGGLLGGDGDVTRGRTMAFTTLVLAQLFNVFNARSDHTTAFRDLFTNAWLCSAVVLSALLQVAVVQMNWLNHAFGTTRLTMGQWLTCVALASAVLWADEAKKILTRSRLAGHHR